MTLVVLDQNILKVMTLSNNLVVICRFQDHNPVLLALIHENLCSVKVWFKNAFTIIEKYESKVLKLNPEGIFGLI